MKQVTRNTRYAVRVTFGFTLVELLVSIAVLGILVGSLIYLIDPNAQFRKSRDARRKADLNLLLTAIELYRNDWNLYPKAGGATDAYSQVNNITGLGASYIGTAPTDPLRTTCPLYLYYVNSSQTAFALFAALENLQDPSATAVKPPPANNGGSSATSITLSSGPCSTSPNNVYNYWLNNP
jgi:prepilin-type N-terminal cleavage/methylation domain-containing protein